MPAKDICEAQVVRALNKEGWEVLESQISIQFEQYPYFYIDLRIGRGRLLPPEQIFVIEVKCFTNPNHEIDEFYHAIGQYCVYRNALAATRSPQPLYLAVPQSIYQTLFQIPILHTTLDELAINLIVIDLELEVIVLWKTY
jgi:hypothetical protein